VNGARPMTLAWGKDQPDQADAAEIVSLLSVK